jgi:hypothetical protein
MRLQILDLAKNDIIDGYHYYEGKEEGLGNYFLINIYGDIESLRLFGGTHRQAYLGFHPRSFEKVPVRDFLHGRRSYRKSASSDRLP